MPLHDVGMQELGLDAFMQILQGPFENPMVARCTESCIHTLKQGKQLVAECNQDFCNLASHLPDWPECMLVSYSQQGLDQELYQNCTPQGVLWNLQAWF